MKRNDVTLKYTAKHPLSYPLSELLLIWGCELIGIHLRYLSQRQIAEVFFSVLGGPKADRVKYLCIPFSPKYSGGIGCDWRGEHLESLSVDDLAIQLDYEKDLDAYFPTWVAATIGNEIFELSEFSFQEIVYSKNTVTPEKLSKCKYYLVSNRPVIMDIFDVVLRDEPISEMELEINSYCSELKILREEIERSEERQGKLKKRFVLVSVFAILLVVACVGLSIGII